MRHSGSRMKIVVAALPIVLFWGAGAPPESPVADAAMRGDVEVVRALLKDGADVNAAQADGMTALHWAAENGDAELAEMLIYAGANVEAVTRLGDYTPLHLAGKAGHAAVARALLAAGSNPNALTTNGSTPLHFAAASGDASTVAVLLDHGADENARDGGWRQTPLMWAAANARVDAIRVLLERGADPSITARVLNVVARSEEDDAAEERRDRRMEALQAAMNATSQVGRQGDNQARSADQARSVKGARPANQAGSAKQPRSAEQPPPADQARSAKEARSANQPASAGQARLAEARVREQPAEEDNARGREEESARGPQPLSYAELIGSYGGLTALLLAVRDGHVDAAQALLDAGANINQVSAGDHTSPLLMAALNGHFDLAMRLLEGGADPNLASDAAATPLYATLNRQWIPKSRHPQTTDYMQQRTTYLQLMEALLEAGADPNVRLEKPLWYTTFGNDYLGVDRTGATPFWRAAYATDVDAMRLLVAYGADPRIPTMKPPQRRRDEYGSTEEDPSGLPPIPVGGPGVYPIHAASGVGYGQGYAANIHRHVPNGWLPAVKYLVEEIGVDVNARDLNGYNAVHHAAARGDNALILYLVAHGADVTAVSREGQTTADMANGPVQRVPPFPETVELLESLGSKNNHNCVSC